MNEKKQNDQKEKIPFHFDWLRIGLGILVLTVLLAISLNSINGFFAEKQAELLEDAKKDFGWVAITIGFTMPIILGCVVPMLACIGCKKGDQRKHLIKGLIIAGAAVIVLCGVCPLRISSMVKQRELAQSLEDMAAEDPEFIIPEDAPDLKEVTTELERVVDWTARSLIALGVLGAYQGARYKKFKDGDLDEDIPADELDDDPPDVDWVEGEKKSKNS